MTGTTVARPRAPGSGWFWLLLAGAFVALASNLDGWLLNGDEGTDFYEAWQLAAGARPGVDFIAEQQPLFLELGRLLIGALGREAAPLRLLAVTQVIVAVLVLATAVRRLWNVRVATLTTGLFLTSGLVVEQTRQYRPDPMMLAWEMIGLAAVLLAAHGGRRRWWALAGTAYGVAFLFKLFGVFPVLGIMLYFGHAFWRRERPWMAIIRDGLAFALPYLTVALGVSAALYSRLGFYYGEAFSQHLSLGEGRSLAARLLITLAFYAGFFVVNGVFTLWLPLRVLNRRRRPSRGAAERVLAWQFVTPLIFLAMTRPMFVRYFIYLTPVAAIFLARELEIAFHHLSREEPVLRRLAPILGALLLLFAGLVTRPSPTGLLIRQEEGTRALASFIASQTAPDERVLSDYAGINYVAGRPSIYEASIIAAGRIQGQVITGAGLIERLEADQVAMVLIHVAGGPEPPNHLVQLVDYDAFREYLTKRYELLTVFDRAGQQIEIHRRRGREPGT